MAFCLFGVLHERCVMPLPSRDVGRDWTHVVISRVPAISKDVWLSWYGSLEKGAKSEGRKGAGVTSYPATQLDF